MPLKDVVKVSRKTYFNPSGWLGYGMLKAQFKLSIDILKNMFTPPVARRQESFDAAMARLKLTEETVHQTALQYQLISIVFFVFGIATTGFSFYIAFQHGNITGWLLGLVCAVLFFTYSFRYSFWHFQIKHRKLGCTFAEWRHGKINDSESGTHD